MKRIRFMGGALLALLWVAPLRAQESTGTIRGSVVDTATQQPLGGVTIAAGARGTRSQADGRFVITDVPVGTYDLRARMLGYMPVTQSVTVTAGQVTLVQVAMTAQAVGLAEIVVTGYGEQRAGDITGAVTQLSDQDFNPGRITVPAQLIQGKVAGVQVVDNNEPGGGTTIRIRGATSVNASSDPLYIIDGMPVATGAGGGLSSGRDPLNFLNPNDIESITVLKDASAAAIYGANAANGVVLITTKSKTSSAGRRGTQIEYSTSASASSVTRLPEILSTSQFIAAVQQYAPTRVSMLGTASTDWLNLITRTSYGQEHNLAVTNTGENLFYRLSLGYLKQDGVLRGTTTERISLGLNYDQRLLNDNLDVKANLRGARANDRFTPGDVLGNAVGMAPTQPVLDPTSGTGYWDWATAGASASNPIASLNLASDHGTTWRTMGNIEGEYRMPFFPALKANVNLGYDVAQTGRETFTPSNLAAQVRQGHGFLGLSNNNQVNSVFETYLNYASQVGLLPGNIDLTGGYSYSQSHSEFSPFSESNISSNFLADNGIPTALNVNNTKNVVDYKLISFFGRANYNLNDRYLVAASVRRDGSSRFGPGHQWGVFPSVSLAWRISQEPFLRSISALSDLKLRGSWAKTGNQAFGDYLQYAQYTFSNNLAQYPLGGTFITTIAPSAVDPNIKWEQTTSYNLGLDFGFLNQRVNGSIDWYTKKTTDLIFYVPVAAGTNFRNYLTTNVGSMQNKGIELTLSADVLRGRQHGLSWTADFTVSHNANKLLSINPNRSVSLINVGNIGGGTGNQIEVLMPGQPINSFFVYQQKYANGKPIYSDTALNMYVDQPTVLDTIHCPAAPVCRGLYRPDSVINSSDLRPFHSPWPTVEIGHTSTFTYGNFDASFTLRSQLGAYVYNNVAAGSAYNNLTDGGSPSNISTAVLKDQFKTRQYFSDYFVQDASFLRMDNITVGYTFKYHDQPLRVYATLQNAFTITGYSGVDPTAGLNGIDNNIYPRSRTFTGGLSVRF
jgi:TonB-linked SusC/RagA family outer membrane protein